VRNRSAQADFVQKNKNTNTDTNYRHCFYQCPRENQNLFSKNFNNAVWSARFSGWRDIRRDRTREHSRPSGSVVAIEQAPQPAENRALALSSAAGLRRGGVDAVGQPAERQGLEPDSLPNTW